MSSSIFSFDNNLIIHIDNQFKTDRTLLSINMFSIISKVIQRKAINRNFIFYLYLVILLHSFNNKIN